MEFACSHVICDWSPQHATSASSFLPQYDNSMCQQFSSSVSLIEHIYDNPICDEQQMKRSYTIHHTTSLKAGHPPVPPPPLPSAPVPRPRRMNKPRPTSIPPPPPIPALQRSLGPPPPVPPRVHVVPHPENRLSANVNVISISVGKLVDVSHAARPENYTSPVNCRKCSATLSCLSLTHNNLWLCEFCRSTNAINCNKRRSCMSRLSGLHCDEVYLQIQRDQDYQDLQDSVVVFCVDISGSMSVTSQVPSHSGSTRYISRLKSIQDALQGALMSLMQQSPRRRVALVTFSNEVVVYGDGTVSPMTLSDWSLVDYDHIWQQGLAFNAPRCISETYYQLIQKVENLHEYGATCLGPAALVSVALASRYPGSKVILCTDGKANIGIGELSKPRVGSNFYKKLALHALNYGVIVSVMTFEGTDCRLAEVGTLADTTGGRVNTVNAGTVASEIQSASEDHVLATGVTLTLLAAEGVYFPFEEEEKHRVVKEIGSVTEELEITFQFAVKPHAMDEFLWRKTVPFQIQLSFKTQGQHRVTRIVTEQRPVSTSSGILARDLNLSLLGVHWAQLCGRLTMEGRVEDAQRQLREQQRLLRQVSEQRPIKQEETFYSNWMDTMSNICSDYDKEYESLSDEAAKHVYQLKRASRISKKSNSTIR